MTTLTTLLSAAEPVITQEEISLRLKDYIAMLARRHSFTRDMKIDRRQVHGYLEKIWPVEKTWEAEARQIWTIIENIVNSIPSFGASFEILLRVSVSDSSLVPVSLPESNEAIALATIDAAQGVMRHCLLPPMDKPPPLNALTVPRGLMVICQPLGHAPDPFVDYRHEIGVESSENLFGERENDKHRQDGPAPQPYVKPDPVREKFELMHKHEQEWELLLLKHEEQEKKEFESAEAETDEHHPDAEEQLSHTPIHHHIYRLIGLTPVNKPNDQPSSEKPEAAPKRNNLLANILRFTRSGGEDYSER